MLKHFSVQLLEILATDFPWPIPVTGVHRAIGAQCRLWDILK